MLAASAVAAQAYAAVRPTSMAEAERLGSEAVLLGELTGNPTAVMLGAIALTLAARTQGQLNDALRHAERAVQAAWATGSPAKLCEAQLWLVATLASLDRWKEAHVSLDACECIAGPAQHRIIRLYRAELRLAEGAVDQAAAATPPDVYDAAVHADAEVVWWQSVLGEIALRRGRLDEARDHLQRAAEVGPQSAPVHIRLLWRRAQLADARGGNQMAASVLWSHGSHAIILPLLVSTYPAASATLVRMALRLGARDDARSFADLAARMVESNPGVSSLAGAAAHADGLLRADPSALCAAERHYAHAGRPLASASAAEDAGRACLAAGDAAAGRRLLTQAARQLESSGASFDQARVRAALGRRSEHQGVSELTSSERRVARLVAKGLTNREVAAELVVSTHTVDSHLRHSFTKLNINNRVKLTRLFLSDGEQPTRPD